MKAKQGLVRRVGLAAVVAAALLTSACAAGQYAQSAAENETIDGTKAQVGKITLGGLAIQTPDNGVSWSKGDDVPVKVVIVNSGQKNDTLTSITSSQITGWGTFGSPADASAYAAAQAAANAPSSGSAGAPSSSAPTSAPAGPQPKKSIGVDAHGRVQFGGETVQGARANGVLLLTGLKTALHPGMTIELTFTFAQAGTVTAQVPVQLTKDPQTSVVPGPSATGQASPQG